MNLFHYVFTVIFSLAIVNPSLNGLSFVTKQDSIPGNTILFGVDGQHGKIDKENKEIKFYPDFNSEPTLTLPVSEISDNEQKMIYLYLIDKDKVIGKIETDRMTGEQVLFIWSYAEKGDEVTIVKLPKGQFGILDFNSSKSALLWRDSLVGYGQDLFLYDAVENKLKEIPIPVSISLSERLMITENGDIEDRYDGFNGEIALKDTIRSYTSLGDVLLNDGSYISVGDRKTTTGTILSPLVIGQFLPKKHMVYHFEKDSEGNWDRYEYELKELINLPEGSSLKEIVRVAQDGGLTLEIKDDQGNVNTIFAVPVVD